MDRVVDIDRPPRSVVFLDHIGLTPSPPRDQARFPLWLIAPLRLERLSRHCCCHRWTPPPRTLRVPSLVPSMSPSAAMLHTKTSERTYGVADPGVGCAIKPTVRRSAVPLPCACQRSPSLTSCRGRSQVSRAVHSVWRKWGLGFCTPHRRGFDRPGFAVSH
jgi:hypothetical protein